MFPALIRWSITVHAKNSKFNYFVEVMVDVIENWLKNVNMTLMSNVFLIINGLVTLCPN